MPYKTSALVMSEGAPEFSEVRGLFVLTVPIGEEVIRIGFMPHDFLRACRDAQETCDGFFAEQRIERLRA